MIKEVLRMAKFRSQMNRADALKRATDTPRWEIGFKWQIGVLSRQGDIDLDLIELMRILGYSVLYELYSSYFALYPTSLGEPQHPDMEQFFDELVGMGILEKTDGGYRQTEKTADAYSKLLEA